MRQPRLRRVRACSKGLSLPEMSPEASAHTSRVVSAPAQGTACARPGGRAVCSSLVGGLVVRKSEGVATAPPAAELACSAAAIRAAADAAEVEQARAGGGAKMDRGGFSRRPGHPPTPTRLTAPGPAPKFLSPPCAKGEAEKVYFRPNQGADLPCPLVHRCHVPRAASSAKICALVILGWAGHVPIILSSVCKKSASWWAG